MIKLGIFGDSFADGVCMWQEDGFQDVGPSWIEHLNLTGNYYIESWGKGGSDLFYSKKLFDQHYKKYDKIIFVVTFVHGRTSVVSMEDGRDRFINPALVIERKKQIRKNPDQYSDYEKKLLDASEQYFTVIEDREYLNLVHPLMVQDIKNKHQNTILLPVVSNSVPGYNYSNLADISMMENKYFNLQKPATRPDCFDARKCHMSEENNYILSRKILEMLEGAPVKLDINDFVLPTKDFAHYFRKHYWPFI